MSSVENRLTALASALELRRLEQIAPVDNLSQSLFDLRAELAVLDEQGKRELLAALNDPADNKSSCLHLSMEDVERFISDFTK